MAGENQIGVIFANAGNERIHQDVFNVVGRFEVFNGVVQIFNRRVELTVMAKLNGVGENFHGVQKFCKRIGYFFALVIIFQGFDAAEVYKFFDARHQLIVAIGVKDFVDFQAAVFKEAREFKHHHVDVTHTAGQIDVQLDAFFVADELLNNARHFRHALKVFFAGAVLVVIENKIAVVAGQKFLEAFKRILQMRLRRALDI